MIFTNLFRPLVWSTFIAFFLILFSCNDENGGEPEIIFTATDTNFSITENPDINQTIGTVEASARKGETDISVEFSISQQSVNNAFSIDAISGEITVSDPSAFDFSTNSEITGVIVVSAEDASSEINLTITIIESMAITANDLSASVVENPSTGYVISEANVTKDQDDQVTYEIVSQSVAGAFDIDASTGVITVADSSVFNFERNESLTATFQVTGMVNSATFELNCNIENIPDEWLIYGNNLLGDAAGDGFGRSLSMSMDESTLVVGAPWNDQNGVDAGQVRVFNNNIGTGWSQIGSSINGPDANGKTGVSVDVDSDGSAIFIGSPNAITYTSSSVTIHGGIVSIYRKNNNDWNFFDSYYAADNWNTNFGFSVAMNSQGDRLIAGAPNDNQVIPLQVWTDNDGLDYKAPGERIISEGRGGHAVDISNSGQVFAESAIGYSTTGRVRVYRFSTSGSGNPPTFPYEQIGQDLMGTNANDRFGSEICLASSGNMIAIGADQVDGTGTKPGYVKVYRLEGSSWVQVGQDLIGEAPGDAFGAKLDLSENGETLVVGAYGNDGNGEDAGHVRVFKLVDGQWVQKGHDIDGEAAGDRFGISVGTGYFGLTISVGADRNDDAGDNAGKVYSFVFESE